MVEIRTDRVLLREINEDDLAAFHMLQSNPEVHEYSGQILSKSLLESQQILEDLQVLINIMRSYNIRDQPVLILAITIPPSNRLIGMIGTFRPREIGISLHPDFWARGYASEAARAFCAWYLRNHPGQQLFAKVNMENERSVKCLRRSGFTQATETEEKADNAYGKDRARQTWLLRDGS